MIRCILGIVMVALIVGTPVALCIYIWWDDWRYSVRTKIQEAGHVDDDGVGRPF